MIFRLAAFTGVWQVLWVLNGSIVALCKSGDPERTSNELQLVPADQGIQWQCIGLGIVWSIDPEEEVGSLVCCWGYMRCGRHSIS